MTKAKRNSLIAAIILAVGTVTYNYIPVQYQDVIKQVVTSLTSLSTSTSAPIDTTK